MNKSQKRLFLICAALILTTLIAFEPMRHNGFVGVDDHSYITNNPFVKAGITRESLVWAFTTPHSNNWHPLTSLSHILDCQLFGLDPFWHHLTNLLFHVANTLLLFGVLKKMTSALWPSAFVAAVFALHPLHVESVAWASERKDVLSGFFWMLTIAAYISYSARPGIRRYLLVVLAFCLGLMAKPMVVTLPFVLILLDYWPLNRLHLNLTKKGNSFSKAASVKTGHQIITTWHLIREKIPLFALSVVSSIITFIIQQSTGAMGLMEKLPLNFRISNALVSYIRYIGKMIYPSRLAFFYLLDKIPTWQPVVCSTILLAASVLIILSRRRYLTVGWLWYLGTLVPVIGLVQVGSQAMADRYTYLPSIGISIMVAWGLAEVFTKGQYRKSVLAVPACIVLAVFMICTRMQVRYWRDNLTLYGHTAKAAENNFRIQSIYGAALLGNNEYDKAVKYFKKALQIKPDYVEAHNGLGKALLKQGNPEEAIKCFNVVLHTDTNLPDVYGNLGLSYAQLGKNDLAVSNWLKSVELDPDSPDNLNNLAWLLASKENSKVYNPADAVGYAQRACELTDYENPSLLDTLAVAYAAMGRFSDAVATAEKALRLAKESENKQLTEGIQNRLRLYKAGQPYTEP